MTREEVLGNFTFRYILLFKKPLRVYGFFPFTYLVTPTAKILIGNINGASNVQAANSMAQKNFSALVWW
jgi:hypothetical protein